MKELLFIAALYLTAFAAVLLNIPAVPPLADGDTVHLTTTAGQVVAARVLLPNEATGLRDTLFISLDDPTAVWQRRQVTSWSHAE